MNTTELTQREKFESWFKASFHPDKTGPYIKDQLFFAWKAASDELTDVLESAQRKIAELNGREVREEGNQFLIVRHPGKAPAIKHCAGNLEGFLRQLLEHEPMATIDIVTHRYYGIGGQWVQDADEYLHMMDAERKSKEVKGE
ncbi:hypothetical protein [Atlantibacter hermannii]|uniref:hypothetical protein n=1 Tax=Atlantibacter hermannii TaxID=565 RepID=UPI0028AA3571|nr:hypothetical protein [Atlantibacter hermannii]